MSVETYLQCNARVHRAGQKNPSVVVHLQGSGVEKRMYSMLQNKVDIHHKIPLFLLSFGDGGVALYAGIVHQYVDFA